MLNEHHEIKERNGSLRTRETHQSVKLQLPSKVEVLKNQKKRLSSSLGLLGGSTATAATLLLDLGMLEGGTKLGDREKPNTKKGDLHR